MTYSEGKARGAVRGAAIERSCHMTRKAASMLAESRQHAAGKLSSYMTSAI